MKRRAGPPRRRGGRLVPHNKETRSPFCDGAHHREASRHGYHRIGSAPARGIRRGLTRLAALNPEARFPNVYFLIGTLSTGGTTAQSGMLIGTEQNASDRATPLDELPDWAQKNFPTHAFESLVGLVVHEAVHTQQKPPYPASRTICCATRWAKASPISSQSSPWDRGLPTHRARSTAARTSTRSGWISSTKCGPIPRSACGCTTAGCRPRKITAPSTSAIGWATGSPAPTTRAPPTNARLCASCSSYVIRRRFCARAATRLKARDTIHEDDH